jgi:serine/threonine-protein kinase
MRFEHQGDSILALGRVIELEDAADEGAREELSEAAWEAMELQSNGSVRCADVVFETNNFALIDDFIEGQPLSALYELKASQRTLFPVDVALRIAIDALQAAADVHRSADEADLQHAFGGLGPDTLLIGTDGATRVLNPLVAGVASSQEGFRIKPERAPYVAPEQWRDEDSDARTDVYAMGCIVWELLANRRLHLGTPSAIKAEVLAGQLMSLGEQEREGLNPPLRSAVEGALGLDPMERFESVLEFAEALGTAGVKPATRSKVAAFVEQLAAKALETQRAATENSTVANVADILKNERTPGVRAATRRGAKRAAAPSAGKFSATPTVKSVLPPPIAQPPVPPARPAAPLVSPAAPKAPTRAALSRKSSAIEASTLMGLAPPTAEEMAEAVKKHAAESAEKEAAAKRISAKRVSPAARTVERPPATAARRAPVVPGLPATKPGAPQAAPAEPALPPKPLSPLSPLSPPKAPAIPMPSVAQHPAPHPLAGLAGRAEESVTRPFYDLTEAAAKVAHSAPPSSEAEEPSTHRKPETQAERPKLHTSPDGSRAGIAPVEAGIYADEEPTREWGAEEEALLKQLTQRKALTLPPAAPPHVASETAVAVDSGNAAGPAEVGPVGGMRQWPAVTWFFAGSSSMLLIVVVVLLLRPAPVTPAPEPRGKALEEHGQLPEPVTAKPIPAPDAVPTQRAVTAAVRSEPETTGPEREPVPESEPSEPESPAISPKPPGRRPAPQSKGSPAEKKASRGGAGFIPSEL